jgi:hypothetical protein
MRGRMFKQYPIEILINSRLKELGINRAELIKRCGYNNISKGLRRLKVLCSGNISCQSSQIIITRLPHALGLSCDNVANYINATQSELQAEALKLYEEWCDNFEPSAFILGTNSRPSQIWAFGLTGGVDRYLRIPLDITESSNNFVDQALKFVSKKTDVEFFGPATGFIINYAPSRSERYDISGNLVEVRSNYYPGVVKLTIGGREIPSSLLGLSNL